MYPEPKPHFNTLSTYAFIEEKGFVARTLGPPIYFTVITEEEYRNRTLKNVVKNISTTPIYISPIKEETISVDEVRQLLDEVEKPHDKDSTKK